MGYYLFGSLSKRAWGKVMPVQECIVHVVCKIENGNFEAWNGRYRHKYKLVTKLTYYTRLLRWFYCIRYNLK